MAESVIHFTSGRPAKVPLSVEELRELFERADPADPYVEVPDLQGGLYVINVDEIVICIDRDAE